MAADPNRDDYNHFMKRLEKNSPWLYSTYEKFLIPGEGDQAVTVKEDILDENIRDALSNIIIQYHQSR